jgi:16S rRNA C1402 (ribose-2'-O) methylase RsmI
VAEDLAISTVDPQARHVHESVHRRQDGYKTHVTVEPETELVTAAELTKPTVKTTTKPSSG